MRKNKWFLLFFEGRIGYEKILSKIEIYIDGCVYFVPVIEGTAARREHNLTKLVSIGEMLLFFGNDELCSRRAAPATETT